MGDSGVVRDGETGKAVVAGTDVTVEEILRAIAGGAGVADVVAANPGLTAEAVAGALEHAANVVDREPSYARPSSAYAGVVREPAAAYGARDVTRRTVVLDAADYEEMLYRMDLLEGIAEGMGDAAAGRTVPHDEVMADLMARYAV